MSRWTRPIPCACSQPLCGLPADSQDLGQRQPGLLGEAVFQRLATEQRHSEERHAAFLADLVDRYDVVVLKGGRCPRLAEESREVLGGDRQLRADRLERDLTVELRVLGAEDNPHAPGPEDIEHPVRPEPAEFPRLPRRRERREKKPELWAQVRHPAGQGVACRGRAGIGGSQGFRVVDARSVALEIDSVRRPRWGGRGLGGHCGGCRGLASPGVLPQLANECLELDPQRRATFDGDVGQELVHARLLAVTPVGLEAAAGRVVEAAGVAWFRRVQRDAPAPRGAQPWHEGNPPWAIPAHRQSKALSAVSSSSPSSLHRTERSFTWASSTTRDKSCSPSGCTAAAWPALRAAIQRVIEPGSSQGMGRSTDQVELSLGISYRLIRRPETIFSERES